MTQQARIQAALEETIKNFVRVEKQKTFDDGQEAKKQADLKFYASHAWKLADMMAAQ